MTYANARYEMLNMGIGMTKVVDDVVVTRWGAELFEVGTWGRESTGLANALKQMGLKHDPASDAAAMVADYQDETGCSWSRALSACNCD
jgi:hypothetical protein